MDRRCALVASPCTLVGCALVVIVASCAGQRSPGDHVVRLRPSEPLTCDARPVTRIVLRGYYRGNLSFDLPATYRGQSGHSDDQTTMALHVELVPGVPEHRLDQQAGHCVRVVAKSDGSRVTTLPLPVIQLPHHPFDLDDDLLLGP